MCGGILGLEDLDLVLVKGQHQTYPFCRAALVAGLPAHTLWHLDLCRRAHILKEGKEPEETTFTVEMRAIMVRGSRVWHP